MRFGVFLRGDMALNQESNGADNLSSLGPRELDPNVLWTILLRRKWVGLLSVTVCVLCALFYLSRTPKMYRASSLLEISSSNPEILGRRFEDVARKTNYSYYYGSKFLETQMALASSRPVAEIAAQRLGLNQLASQIEEELNSIEAANHPEFAKDLRPELADKLSLIGLERLPTEKLVDVLKDYDYAGAIQGRISLMPIEKSDLVMLQITDKVPKNAQNLANEIAEAVIAHNLKSKVETTESAIEWLSGQENQLKLRLEESENLLQEFKEKNNILSVSIEDRRSMAVQRLSSLNKILTDLIANRISIESQISILKNAKADPEVIADFLANIEATDNRSNLSKWIDSISELKKEEIALIAKYTAKHPLRAAVRQKIKANRELLYLESKTVLDSLQQSLDYTKENERKLNSKIAEVKADVLRVGQNEVEYKRLKRESAQNLELYSLVIKRHKESKLSQMLKVSNIRIHEYATLPGAPIRPIPKLIITLGFLAGILLAFAIIALLEILDRTVKSQEHVEQNLRVPFLGLLPVIELDRAVAKATVHREHNLIKDPRSSLAECARAIRTNILFMDTERKAQTIVVTSASPQEGKSTNVYALGVTMAQSGARTVIVDTDMRRPRIHKTFGLPNSDGVTSVLLGDLELDDAVRATDVENLDVLPCGIIPPNPAELLHTEQFAALVQGLRDRYDRVIFDSPPVSAVSDALVLSSIMDGTIFVLQAGKTTLPSAERSTSRLRGVGAKFLGAILNQVDLDDKSGYYYHYAYYRSGYYISDQEETGQSAS